MNYYQETSNYVEGVDRTFFFIFGVSIFFLVGITFVMLLFVRKYRRSKHPHAVQVKENKWIEITWTGIPLILVMFMFYYGYIAYSPMRNAPPDSIVVKTIAKMWEWNFEYSNGKQSKELVVPINKPIKCNLVSLDVIHGFFVPAFRVKEDVVPGKNNSAWFIPKELGEYEIMCTAYCGLKHSFMESKVIVVTEDRFKKWLDSLPENKVEPEGLTLIKNNACTGCHSLDGTKGIAPTFNKLYGSKVIVLNEEGVEKEVDADEFYLNQSIIDPDVKVVKGYKGGIMRSYKGTISKENIKKIIEYLKTLK
jgi:cytochrome c oxidase subunit 2